MPVKVSKRNGLYRLVDADKRIEKTPRGVARDGGGHKSRAKAERQAGYVNEGSK